MKIAFFEVEPWEAEYLKGRLGSGAECMFFEEPLRQETAIKAKGASIVSVFIYSNMDASLLGALPELSLIATRSTGYDHIDIEFCKKNNITVVNVPSYGENTVAEHTFALILSLSRKIHKTYERTVRANFSLDNLRGFDIAGKTLGVVGMGRIGRHVVRISKGFQMNTIVYDPFMNQKMIDEYKIEAVDFKELLFRSDIVTLHLPYNKKTHHMINTENLHYFKRGAILINTARGGLVETKAVVKGLIDGILAGAGLDVLEHETLIKEERQVLSRDFSNEELLTALENRILLTFDNVIITPHNAFNSNEALRRILDTTIENITAFNLGNPTNRAG